MSLTDVKKRIKKIEDVIYYNYKDKWKTNIIRILYQGTDEDINNNKKYHLNYKGKDLIYDKIEDFYNEYNVYPNKDINPFIIEIVDNSYLEKYLYM